MNRLPLEKQVAVAMSLMEGCSIRSTVRMTGVAKNTISKLLLDLGAACWRYHDEYVENVECQRIQIDEVWSYVAMKQKHVPLELKGILGIGDVWCWTAIAAESKLMLSWLVGSRDARTAEFFLKDVASRLAGRVQLTTDGYTGYIGAVSAAFGDEIDYAQLQKLYGDPIGDEIRYSPSRLVGIRRSRVSGNPDPAHVSTSYAERANLTVRMGIRRFTRLTNAFSKKLENHEAAVSAFMFFYNYARVHQTLRVTPAMAAGLANHVWELEEILGLINRVRPGSRGYAIGDMA